MHRAKVFNKVTKKGTVLKIVKEHYLRDDVVCGSKACTVCPTATTAAVLDASPAVWAGPPAKPHYLVPDTNVFINQMDVMEHAAIMDVVILETVLEEVKHLSTSSYTRLRALIAKPERRYFVLLNEHHRDLYIEKTPGESPNDRNDRAIRTATIWLTEHLRAAGIVAVMLTQDEGNRTKARAEGCLASSVRAYVRTLSEAHPELEDILADPSATGDVASKSGISYAPHLTPSEIQTGVSAGRFVTGIFRVATYSQLEGTVYVSAKGLEILISGIAHMNRAMHDDTVAIELLPEAQWQRPTTLATATDADADAVGPAGLAPALDAPLESQAAVRPTAKVVGIVRRAWRAYCGSIDVARDEATTATVSQSVLFYPLDRRIPRIRLRTRQIEALAGQRIVVAIDDWDVKSRFPAGHFVRTIGPIGDRETETEVILLEHDVAHHPFSPAVLGCLPSAAWTADTDARTAAQASPPPREDLRHLDICSVDPPGCTDIDDALHVVVLEPGRRYQVGVHIADVTHFVRPNTPMDMEAAARGTTVYLVGRRIDMLPELLGSNLCSLRENVDRFAFSCIWDLDADANIISTRFCKSIIRSRASLTYDEAQRRIDTPSLTDPIATGLRLLNQLAKKLKQRRIDAGALFLASPEVRFNLENESQDPVDVEMKQMQDTNSMVEEFMLLANTSVARRTFEAFPSCALLRRHAAPELSRFDYLIEAAAARGVRLNPATSKTLAESLDNAVVDGEPHFNKLLRILTTRCMTPAVYICSGTEPYEAYRHYGLAAEIYTHFTSPIRRYADVMVHRLLAAALNVDALDPGMLDKDAISSVVSNINRRHKMAQYAARASVELFTVLFFRNKRLDEDAHIIRVLRNGIVVLVSRFGLEGLVQLTLPRAGGSTGAAPPATGPFTLDAARHRLTASALGVTLGLFETVVVRLSVEEETSRRQSKVHLALVSPEVAGISVPPTAEEAVATAGTSASARTAVLSATAVALAPERIVPEAPLVVPAAVTEDVGQANKKRGTKGAVGTAPVAVSTPAPAPAPAPARLSETVPGPTPASGPGRKRAPKPTVHAKDDGAFSDEEAETVVLQPGDAGSAGPRKRRS